LLAFLVLLAFPLLLSSMLLPTFLLLLALTVRVQAVAFLLNRNLQFPLHLLRSHFHAMASLLKRSYN
jgi:hypothetical protein